MSRSSFGRAAVAGIVALMIAGCNHGSTGEVKAEGAPPPGAATIGVRRAPTGNGQPGATGNATSQSAQPTAQ